MKILVTGAAGFSGSHIAYHLAWLGHDIIAGVRNRPPPPWLANAAGVDVMRMDLAEGPPNLPPLDGVVHAAATSHNSGTEEQVERDGAQATTNLQLALMGTGCTNLVYLSSVSAFGSIEVPLLSEATVPNNPDTYGLSKLAGENVLRQAVANGGLTSAICLRLPGVIGPGAARVWLSCIAHDLRHNRPVTVYNANAPFNNAVHVHDLAKLCARALAAPRRGFDSVVLAARGQATPYLAVETLAHAMRSHSRIEIDPAPRPGFVIDPSRAIECHGYDPMDIRVMLTRYGRECR
jgi:nucleoside-diphosphate-sugar epimerase